MKLLIITQSVDCDHPVLGFFHRWIEEFAKHCESVTVIGQAVGRHALPHNVCVLSLGKERGLPRFLQLFRFWLLIILHRRAYDAVFVHMTPVWVILGWKVWFLLRRPIYLWYEARGKRMALRFALCIVRKVFSASAHGMPLRTRRSVITGHGIDTERFVPGNAPREAELLVTVGRITAAKRLPFVLRALAALPASYRLVIVGAPVSREDQATQAELLALMHRLHLQDRVTMRALPPADLPPLLQRAALFLHASATALDKAVLEAMACGCAVISCADAVQPVLPETLRAHPEEMAGVAQWFCSLPQAEQEDLRQELRRTVVERHGLARLIARLCEEMSPL